eukprot:950036-Alexandrium_andersonii.AAC.1
MAVVACGHVFGSRRAGSAVLESPLGSARGLRCRAEAVLKGGKHFVRPHGGVASLRYIGLLHVQPLVDPIRSEPGVPEAVGVEHQ